MPALLQSDWADIIGHVRVQHPELVRGWFSQLQPVALFGGVLRVQARNPLQVRYLEDNCRAAFTEGAQAALGQLVATTFETAAPSGNGQEHPPATDDVPELDLGGQLQLNQDYVFDHFVTGPGNRLAHAASVAVADAPGTTYNPLFIHGDVGLGKTHLLQAICHQANHRGTCANTLYISCETFVNHFIEAVERGAMKQFRYRYRAVDMLVIDDIQFLGERERSQEEFFHTFNTLHQARKQIILSADCSPAEIPSLEDRPGVPIPLRAGRLHRHALFGNADGDHSQKGAIAVHRSGRRRGQVHRGAHRIQHPRSGGALVKLDALSQTGGGQIDLALARSALSADAAQPSITVQQIVDVVTRYFSVRLADLQSKKRTKSVTLPRQVCMYLARELTSHSLEEVGGFFGGRDHTTVLHAHRTIGAARESDRELDQILSDLTHLLRRRRIAV
jgi:chromosomal replication initiator protein